MKKWIIAAAVAACWGQAQAQTAQELLDAKNTDHVLAFGMNPNLTMWSPLKQIDRSNVKRLVPVWSFSTANDMGELSQPTIYNGVMYVANGNWTYAIDVATGRQIWRTPVTYDRGALRVTTGGAYMRGAATIYNGKLFRQNIDAHIVALDMKTGKEVWRQKFAEWKESYGGIVAPTIANGVLISGMAGGDRTARGFVEGYDPDTGKRLWRFWTVPEPGQPGSETWPHKDFPDAWKYGGAATWQPGTYDPELDLFYIGTGNAEPYNPKYRGGMDSLYAASVLAIRPKTGELVWYYQYLPNDSFDFDGTAESILADMRIDGKPRKVLINVNKNGFVYVIDRTNGKLVSAHPFVAQNWAKHIDLKTGRPVLTDLLERAIKGETIDLAPRLATNATLSAYNQRTGTLYLNSWELIRVMKFVDPELQVGQGYTGIETSSKFPKPAGYHMAMNPLTGKVLWKTPLEDYASSAGMLGTEGGVLFTGKLTGEFLALDQDTGKQLWSWKTGSSVNAPPITYTHQGVQYVTILSGRGGSNPTRAVGAIVPSGGTVVTFALLRD
ncbi:MAG TPA: PQQ-dependent dehydrogenase, methanol/ethanol family [Burkholderiales bacterium]|nr:PQQ-dependent dehydrogenase, methanol/ethanol family [Burkholderiales bacterium]